MRGNRHFTDEEIIASLKSGAGSNAAIHFMYEQYFDGLARFIENNQGSREEAEDVFQDVLVNFVALVKLDKFKGESSIKTFLFSMNRFSWLNELKRKGRASTRELKYEHSRDAADTDFTQEMLERESKGRLESLMQQLGETCKKILLLFYYEELSMKDILQQLDYENEQVVRNKKYKCLKQLEQLISSNAGLKNTFKNLLNG